MPSMTLAFAPSNLKVFPRMVEGPIKGENPLA